MVTESTRPARMWAPSACSRHTDSGACSRRRAEAAVSHAGLCAASSPELADPGVPVSDAGAVPRNTGRWRPPGLRDGPCQYLRAEGKEAGRMEGTDRDGGVDGPGPGR